MDTGFTIQNEDGDDYNFDYQYPEDGQMQILLPVVEELPQRLLASRVGKVANLQNRGASRMGQSTEPQRPMTSINSANYRPPTSSGYNNSGANSMKTTPTTAVLQKKNTTTPDYIAKELERTVNSLVEESALCLSRGETRNALEKAKEAQKKERQLSRHREANGLDQNIDTTFCVHFNLAHCYHKSGSLQESLSVYNAIVKNKNYQNAARMRINIGNILFEQHKYQEAIKNYKMACDQIPNDFKEIRFKVVRNIGNAWIGLGNFQQAVQSFESVVESCPDFPSALNLILCYYSIGNKEKMRSVFNTMLKLRTSQRALEIADGEEENSENTTPFVDGLKQLLKEKQKLEDRYIILAAKLIAPAIEKDFASGFDYVVDSLRATGNTDLANELEISKGLAFMKKKDITKAIETLKQFEKKDQVMAATASTNLSFIYFLERDYQNAEKYAELGIKNDPYNAKAFVNKGNCMFVRNRFEDAKELYLKALSCESDCIEAVYNLGLVEKKLQNHEKALEAFKKLQIMIPNHPEVTYQIASITEQLGIKKEAEEQFKLLLAIVPSDPAILQRMGSLMNEIDDSIAQQFYQEAYRYFPSDLNVLSWLGAHYSKSELYERAVVFFQKGALLDPSDLKWMLLIAGCYRKLRNYQQAKEIYETVLKKDVDNIESLKHLITICNDLGYKDQVEQYVSRLANAEQRGKKAISSDFASPRERNPKRQELDQKNQLDDYVPLNQDELSIPGRKMNQRPKLAIDQWEEQPAFPARPGTAGIKKKPVQSVDEEFSEDNLRDDFLPL